MTTGGRAERIVEGLEIVDLVVPVDVVAADNLIAAKGMQEAVDHLKSEGLIEAMGNSLPAYFRKVTVDSLDAPDIAKKGRNGGVPVLEECQAHEKHGRLIGVLLQNREVINDVATGFCAQMAG